MSHAAHKGHRSFTLDSAVRTANATHGVKIDREKKFVFIDYDAHVGNGTWGALDYLWIMHKFITVRLDKTGKNSIGVCTKVE